MEAFVVYLLKSSGILVLFYACYRLFLSKETLFTSNRWFLISGLAASLFLPFMNRTKTVYLDLTSAAKSTHNLENIVLSGEESISMWPNLLFGIYAIGASFFAIRLILQINSLRKFIIEGQTVKELNFNYIRSSKNIQPFSFFNYIIYNPLNHTTKDLKFILAHEQVHANQKHTLDILFIEVVLLLQWFNPIAWGYKYALKQNLEFLADSENTALEGNKKHYQYILLNQVIGKHNLSIVNPFFNSLIKKRIVMINQMPSQRRNVLKTLTVIPFLVLFLYSFNVKTEYSMVSEISAPSSKHIIDISIDKDTSDEAFAKIKSDLENDKIDFSYTLVRNENREIISLSVQVAGGSAATGKFNSSYESSSEDDTISPTYIFIDTTKNSISIGTGKKADASAKVKSIHWVSDAETDAKEIIITKINGEKHIVINGKEVHEEELDAMDIHIEEKEEEEEEEEAQHIFSISGSQEDLILIKENSKDGEKHISIHTDFDEDQNIEIIQKESSEFFIINSEEGEPLYIIDGKESTAKEMKKLNPNNIASINVVKGKKSKKKYGKKGKNGVLEIATKEN